MKSELDIQEKALNVRRAAKMEKVGALWTLDIVLTDIILKRCSELLHRKPFITLENRILQFRRVLDHPRYYPWISTRLLH